MRVDFTEQKALNRYHLMTQTIIPRPIAWILSENEDASYNLAPFSFFNAVCSDPPLLAVSIGRKAGGDEQGQAKDTRVNLLSGRPFVIHVASVAQAEPLNNSAAELPYGESEIERSELALADFPGCPLPRLAECPVAYHCELFDHHELGPNKQAIIYAEIKQLYVDDALIEQRDGRTYIDADKMNPLARLGGANYAPLAERFALVRPK